MLLVIIVLMLLTQAVDAGDADAIGHVGCIGGGAPSSIAYDVIVINPYALSDVIFKNGFD